MTNRALSFSSVPALLAALVIAAPASAQTTECRPGDLFCAELRIGPGRAGVRIGGGDPVPPPPPPPPVVVQPPTVYVQPAPPPPPPPPPPMQVQPPTVYVQPAPPPPVVYAQPMAQPVLVQPAQDRFPASSTGLHLHLSGLFAEQLAMGGVGGAFRIRPNPHLAVDLGAGVYGGEDYNGLERVDVPLQADLLVFFNPQHRFQFYALVGAGASFGYAEGFNRNTLNFDSREYAHLGGELGLGVEWRLSRFFALNFDVRGFIRQRVDGNPEPEFIELTATGVRGTDTSGGVLGRLGMTFYFPNN